MSDRTYRALLVANSFYSNDPNNLLDLEGPRNDPAILRDALIEDGVGLFSPDNVRLAPERTHAEIQLEIEDLFSSATARDTILFYYSGHGRVDVNGDLHLCARDTRTDRLRSTAVAGQWISEAIAESGAGTTIVILDCCHAGAFKGGDLSAPLSGRGRFVLSSARATENARDTDVRNRASVFTAALVDALRGAAPDRDGDGMVTVSDVYEYVHQRLRSSGKQIPLKRFDGSGDVAIALRPGAPVDHAAVKPPDLDVSPTEIDLGEIFLDDDLPVEKVAVINRGGGTLDWTVEASHPWVEPEQDPTGIKLRLRPQLGRSRANLYVEDRITHQRKTVRIQVVVLPGHTERNRVSDRPGAGIDHKHTDAGPSARTDVLPDGSGPRPSDAPDLAVADRVVDPPLPRWPWARSHRPAQLPTGPRPVVPTRRRRLAVLLTIGLVGLGSVIALAIGRSPALGYRVVPYAQNFPGGNPLTGAGPTGMAFDASGDLLVADVINGRLYEVPPGGAGDSPGRIINEKYLGHTTFALAESRTGQLYADTFAGHGNILQLDPRTGDVIRTVIDLHTNLNGLALDPVSGDLFVAAPGLHQVIRVTGIDGTRPATATIYIAGTHYNFDGIAFEPVSQGEGGRSPGAGTLWGVNQNTGTVYGFTGTSQSGPVRQIFVYQVKDQPLSGVVAIGASGDRQQVIVNGNKGLITMLSWVWKSGPISVSQRTVASGGTRGDFMTTDSAGCIFATQSNSIEKVELSNGTCDYAAAW